MYFINVSAKDKVQDFILNQLKPKVNATHKKNEKLTTNFEAVNDEDVINKKYLDTNLAELEGHILYIEEKFIEFKYHESFNENVSIE